MHTYTTITQAIHYDLTPSNGKLHVWSSPPFRVPRQSLIAKSASSPNPPTFPHTPHHTILTTIRTGTTVETNTVPFKPIPFQAAPYWSTKKHQNRRIFLKLTSVRTPLQEHHQFIPPFHIKIINICNFCPAASYSTYIPYYDLSSIQLYSPEMLSFKKVSTLEVSSHHSFPRSISDPTLSGPSLTVHKRSLEVSPRHLNPYTTTPKSPTAFHSSSSLMSHTSSTYSDASVLCGTFRGENCPTHFGEIPVVLNHGTTYHICDNPLPSYFSGPTAEYRAIELGRPCQIVAGTELACFNEEGERMYPPRSCQAISCLHIRNGLALVECKVKHSSRCYPYAWIVIGFPIDSVKFDITQHVQGLRHTSIGDTTSSPLNDLQDSLAQLSFTDSQAIHTVGCVSWMRNSVVLQQMYRWIRHAAGRGNTYVFLSSANSLTNH